jgi:hypothetical protein
VLVREVISIEVWSGAVSVACHCGVVLMLEYMIDVEQEVREMSYKRFMIGELVFCRDRPDTKEIKP